MSMKSIIFSLIFFCRILYETYLYHKLNEKKEKQSSFSLRHKTHSVFSVVKFWVEGKTLFDYLLKF
jgi:hypothetical protein